MSMFGKRLAIRNANSKTSIIMVSNANSKTSIIMVSSILEAFAFIGFIIKD
jgi:hypothetical protein